MSDSRIKIKVVLLTTRHTPLAWCCIPSVRLEHQVFYLPRSICSSVVKQPEHQIDGTQNAVIELPEWKFHQLYEQRIEIEEI